MYLNLLEFNLDLYALNTFILISLNMCWFFLSTLLYNFSYFLANLLHSRCSSHYHSGLSLIVILTILFGACFFKRVLNSSR